MNKRCKESEFILEKNGNAFLKISNPVFYDMFWQAYEVEYLTDLNIIGDIKNPEFWDDVSFFNVGKKSYSPYAIVALSVFNKQGKLIVRGEYLE